MVSVQAPGDVSSNAVLAQAADAMESENFDGAVFVLKQALDKKPAGRIARLMQQMLEEAETALEKQTYLREASREYAPIVELVKRTATRALGCAEFAEFRQQYPDYDPQNVTAVCAQQARSAPKPRVSRVVELLLPFEWVEIPAGRVELEDGHGVFDVPTLSLTSRCPAP
jgi:hypothetical protein